MPQASRLVELEPFDASGETYLVAQAEPVGDMVGIGLQLGLGGEHFRPFPFLLKRLVEVIGIFHALDIDAGAGIPVPVPCPADTFARLEADQPVVVPKPMQRVHAAEAGADDDDVDDLACAALQRITFVRIVSGHCRLLFTQASHAMIRSRAVVCGESRLHPTESRCRRTARVRPVAAVAFVEGQRDLFAAGDVVLLVEQQATDGFDHAAWFVGTTEPGRLGREYLAAAADARIHAHRRRKAHAVAADVDTHLQLVAAKAPNGPSFARWPLPTADVVRFSRAARSPRSPPACPDGRAVRHR